jgi:uncharacterized protein (TIGR02271 family)
MTLQTIVAVYDTAAHADAAVRDLETAQVPVSAISRHARDDMMPGGTAATGAPVREKGFWSSLFGSPDHDNTVYDRSLESGSTVVAVRVPEEHFELVSAILEQHDPVDLDERAAGYGAAETTTTATTAPAVGAPGTATAATDGETIRLAEEALSVGKRAVSGGTTRIRRYVVETPVEEQVTLHSENVTMERRPVSDTRPVDAAAFTDKVIEMTETSEEAVVSKTARVKEEVSLHKEATDRVETVKDTVRREDVEIEQVPGTGTSTPRPTEAAPAMPQTPTPRPSDI